MCVCGMFEPGFFEGFEPTAAAAATGAAIAMTRLDICKDHGPKIELNTHQT